MLTVVPFRADAHEQELLDWAQSAPSNNQARNLWQVLNSLIARSAQMEGNEFREQVYQIKAKFADLRAEYHNQSSTPGIKDYGDKNFAPPSPRPGPITVSGIRNTDLDANGRDVVIMASAVMNGVIRNAKTVTIKAGAVSNNRIYATDVVAEPGSVVN